MGCNAGVADLLGQVFRDNYCAVIDVAGLTRVGAL